MLCDTAGVGGEGVLHLSTGSPFGHHPRLSMGCPRRGQWMSAQEDVPLTSTHAYHIWSCGYSHSSHRLTPSPYIVYGLADTLHSTPIFPPLLSHPHRAASGGGAPCVTAGDTRAKARGNPWKSEGEPVEKRGGTRGKVDSTNFRHRRRRTESVEGETRIGSSGCCATPPVSEVREFFTYPRVRPSGITRG